MPRYILKTLGCKANLYDSQLIEHDLQSRGWNSTSGKPKKKVVTDETRTSSIENSEENSEMNSGEGTELCIINSCTVTDEADRQTRKMAARLAKENPHAKIVITGCAAEVDPQGLLGVQGVHAVVGNQDKNRFVDLLLTSHILKHSNPTQPEILGKVLNYNQILSQHPIDREWPAASDSFFSPPTQLKGQSKKTRAFLKIQEGCNSFCTYCIIPYGRGPSRSLRPRELLNQVQTLVSDGIREVVITGTNIGEYGEDWSPTPALGDLLEMIFAETSLERVRVSSLDPTEITPQIISLMKSEPRFCPHFHVSLQSPHSRILKLMKRKYKYEDVETCLRTISDISTRPGYRNGVFVGMDIITGFPGESDEDFEWTYKALESLPWHRLHVFPYSERKNTPATRLPNSVPQSVRVQRARKLNQLSMDRLTQQYRKVLGECKAHNLNLDDVLLERSQDSSWYSGYSKNYLRVLIRAEEGISLQPNQMVSVTPVDLMLDSKAGDVALICAVC